MALTRETATTLRTVIQTMIEVPEMDEVAANIVASNVILILRKFNHGFVLIYDGNHYNLDFRVEGGERFDLPLNDHWARVLERAHMKIKQERFREAVVAKKMRDALGAV